MGLRDELLGVARFIAAMATARARRQRGSGVTRHYLIAWESFDDNAMRECDFRAMIVQEWGLRLLICAVVEAENARSAWSKVKGGFPDARQVNLAMVVLEGRRDPL